MSYPVYGRRAIDFQCPKIVCLCGSTKFKSEFEKANLDETLKGHIVLTVGAFGHQSIGKEYDRIWESKEALDSLHLEKINLADEVLVINPGGYIGESTRKEIDYAKSQRKDIRYLEQEAQP